MLPIDLPPVVKKGDPGHPDDHNKLRAALDVLNRGKTEPGDLEPYAKTIDLPDLKDYAKKTEIPDTSGLAPKANPIFTGNVTTPAIKITTGAAAGKVWTAKDGQGVGEWRDVPHSGDWQDWTPEIDGEGWEIGNGKTYGELYKTPGNTCILRAQIVFGTTSKFGAGQLRLKLPFAPRQLKVTAALGDATNIGIQESWEPDSPTFLGELYIEKGEYQARFVVFEQTGGGYMTLTPVTKTVPLAFAAGNEVRVPWFAYEFEP